MGVGNCFGRTFLTALGKVPSSSAARLAIFAMTSRSKSWDAPRTEPSAKQAKLPCFAALGQALAFGLQLRADCEGHPQSPVKFFAVRENLPAVAGYAPLPLVASGRNWNFLVRPLLDQKLTDTACAHTHTHTQSLTHCPQPLSHSATHPPTHARTHSLTHPPST